MEDHDTVTDGIVSKKPRLASNAVHEKQFRFNSTKRKKALCKKVGETNHRRKAVMYSVSSKQQSNTLCSMLQGRWYGHQWINWVDMVHVFWYKNHLQNCCS